MTEAAVWAEKSNAAECHIHLKNGLILSFCSFCLFCCSSLALLPLSAHIVQDASVAADFWKYYGIFRESFVLWNGAFYTVYVNIHWWFFFKANLLSGNKKKSLFSKDKQHVIFKSCTYTVQISWRVIPDFISYV